MNERLLEYIKNNPKSKAKEIANALGIDKKDVNSALYGALRSKVSQNKAYQWSIKKSNTGKKIQQTNKNININANSDDDINKLCTYYLSCLGYDNKQTEVFSKGKFGLDYFELNEILSDEIVLEENDQFITFKKSILKERSAKELSFGYPINIKKILRKKDGQAFEFLQPLFVFNIEKDENKNHYIDKNSITINSAVIKVYSGLDDNEIMTEVAELKAMMANIVEKLAK